MKYIFTSIFMMLQLTIYAQDSTLKELKTVVVTANIISSELKNTGRNITIIDRKMIEQAPVKTIDGILQYALNVDVRSRSSVGVQADVSIRGGNFDQTLFLLDGVKINDPQTGHHSLNIPISMSQIERIEILQGGSSRVFGPSAFSGVVNIITKKITKNAIGLTGILGQYGLRNYALNANLVLKNFHIGYNTELLKSDGYTANTAFNKQTHALNVGQLMRKGSLNLYLGYVQNHFHASNFYSPAYTNEYEEIASKFADLNWTHNFSNKLSSVLRANYRRHNDMFDLNNYRNSNAYNSINFHQTDVYDFEYKWKWINKWGKTAFGAEYRSENIISNRLGNALSNPKSVADYANVFYNKGIGRNNLSAYLEHKIEKEKWIISAGNLINYHSQFGLAFYPGIDVNYALNKQNNLYSSVNRSLRYPTFTELYLVSATVVSDPNLKPEKAVTFEIGHKFNSKLFNSTLSIFYRKTQDAIDKIKKPSDAVPLMVNINNINMFGIEIAENVNLAHLTGKSIFKNLTANYAYLQADQRENGFVSFYTLNYLKHKFSAGLNVEPIKNLNLGVWYTYKFRNGTYQWDAKSEAITYQPVKLLDVRASYNLKKSRIFIDANNIADYKYVEYGFVTQPGRWISGGISVNL